MILVPQPSDDPNDPLVGLIYISRRQRANSSQPELASLVAGFDPFHPIFCLSNCINTKSTSRGKYRHLVNNIGKRLYADSTSNRVPFMRGWGCRVSLCCLSKSMGQTTSVLAWDYNYNHQQCLGGCEWKKLHKSTLGTDFSRSWVGPFRSLGECKRR